MSKNSPSQVALATDVIRPYSGIDEFSELLAEAEIFLSSRNSWTADETLVFSKVEYEHLTGKLRINFGENYTVASIRKACSAANIQLEQIDINVRLRCLAMKRSEVLQSRKLSTILGGIAEFTLFPNTSIPLTAGREVNVEIYLTLNTDIKNNFPYPYLKSTWLDQKTFQLRAKRDDSFGFLWNAMTQEDRIKMNLHKDSLVHIVHQLSLIECDNIQDAVEVWVDESYLNALKTHSSKRLSRLLQRILVKDVLTSVIKNAFDKMKEENDGSPVPFVEIETRPVVKQVFGALEKRTTVNDKKTSAEKIYTDMFENMDRIPEYVEDLFSLRKTAEYLQNGGEADA